MSGTQNTGQLFTPIVKATDLNSALQAIASITQVINLLTNSQAGSPTNNLVRPQAQGQKLGPNFSDKKAQDNSQKTTQRFVETDRTTEKVKIVNPEDDTQFVIVERTNSITFVDRLTGITIVFNNASS